jgi:serine/threonine protein kinase
LLKNESTIYHHLQTTDKIKSGIPRIKWFGKDDTNYYMVIDLLGESLQSLKNRYSFFSLEITLKLGIQILQLLKTIHDKGLVHRDIKPDNFLLGRPTGAGKQLHIIDFGFCKSFLNEQNKHKPIKKMTGLVGSLTYASLHAHDLWDQSRRDDLESLGYMLVYFCLGKLEWQCNHENDSVKAMKEQFVDNEDLPVVLLIYFQYVRALSFEEIPNYKMLIELFWKEIERIKFKEEK